MDFSFSSAGWPPYSIPYFRSDCYNIHAANVEEMCHLNKALLNFEIEYYVF